MAGRSLGSLRALRHRDFALLWAGGLVSNAGSWMQTVAVGALVVEATGQALWAALVAVAAFLPIGLFAPVGGAIADRVDRRRAVIILDGVEGVLAAVLAVLAATGRATPGTVIAVVLVAGCSSAVRFPFQQAVLPDVVPREDLLAAVSLGAAQFNLGRVVGPALAGIVLAAGSFSLAFAINAVSFLAAMAAFALVRLPPRAAPTEEGGLIQRISAGARAARAEPGCRAAVAVIAIVAFLASPFISLVPAVADRLVDGGARATATATGALTTAQGIGAVLGALALVPMADRFGRRRALLASLLGTPLALCAYAWAPNLAVATVVLAVVGALYIGVLSGLSTTVQLRAPEEYRARILSLYMVALGLVYPLGSVVQGAVADAVGLPETTTAFALVLVAVLVALRFVRPSVLMSLGDPAFERGEDVDATTGPGEPVTEPGVTAPARP